MLQVRLPGGGPATPRKLSFRALSILQIGHVYEGLLDHTAVKATEPVLGLNGPRDHEPEVPLSRLEAPAAKGEDELLAFVKEETGRSSVAPVKRLLASGPDDLTLSRFRTACQGDDKLWERIKPFAGCVGLDTFDYPVVILPGSVYVTAGTDRRSSGTHYTPESLTKPIVQYTLEPLVYEGPAEGKPKDQWRLKLAAELLALKICDLACGSGAFLVQVCIYLAARLLEAWEEAERRVEGSPRITPYGEVSKGLPDEQLIPLARQERLIYACRLVAERCVYGVDKNPLAVEMAKLSLWLLTLAKDKPFTFLDHAIRCGDSLVGLSSIDQLLRFSITKNAKVRPLMEQQRQQIEKRLQATMLLRKQIETQPSNTPQDIERKTLMLANVEDQTKRLRYAADMLLAASWEARNTGELEAALNGILAEVEYKFKDLPTEQLEEEANKRLRKVGISGRFHWPLEFPEVFTGAIGFGGIVGNPPFLGGIRISAVIGDSYLSHLKLQYGGGDRADLCTYFILRARTLLETHGHFGLLATNTIAQGDSRKFGLDVIEKGGSTIVRATPSRKWPGTASIEVTELWVCKGAWTGKRHLNNKPVGNISPYLDSDMTADGRPFPLRANAGLLFKGVDHLGEGFLLHPDEASHLINRDKTNAEVVLPFLNGKDLNSHPAQQASRWAIFFRDWPLTRDATPSDYRGKVAADYPDCLKVIEERVKPYRQRKTTEGDYVLRSPLPQKWWIFNCPRNELYATIENVQHVIARPELSNTHAFSILPTSLLFSNQLCVFALDGCGWFAILQSTIHEVWARQFGSTMRTDLRYTTADCFETFPMPSAIQLTARIGDSYNVHRNGIMLDRQEGVTKTYNHFHDPDESTADIQRLRDLHVEMDKTVAAAYGWSDLDLGHGFHETKQGPRFTISEAARREVLARLLKLNHERYAEEVAQGLHDKKKGKAAKAPRKSKGTASTEPSLFGEED